MDDEFDTIAGIVTELTGLHFPGERRSDLERNLCSAAAEFGFTTFEKFSYWLKNNNLTREQVEILADYLTIGETYFFRDSRCLSAFREKILTDLIKRKYNEGKYLRIWSAGCCTGEEPYTIAIILKETIPCISDWNITILATDINRRFVKKAVEGIYSEWSFRDTTPIFRKRYFTPARAGHYEIIPEIKSMVKFSILNLAENSYPSVLNNTNAIDVIFCRNVLMYFSEEQIANVAKKFFLSLNDRGYLIVSPSEYSQILSSKFELDNTGETLFYMKNGQYNVDNTKVFQPELISSNNPYCQSNYNGADSSSEEMQYGENRKIFNTDLHSVENEEPVMESENYTESVLEEHLKNGDYSVIISKLLPQMEINNCDEKAMIILARAYANLGELDEARKWCEKALSIDKLNAEYHHLLSAILLEQNESIRAEKALLNTIYSDPEFIMAYFSLGSLARSQGRAKDAGRYLVNALNLLSVINADETVPGSEGLTAGRLSEIIKLLL